MNHEMNGPSRVTAWVTVGALYTARSRHRWAKQAFSDISVLDRRSCESDSSNLGVMTQDERVPIFINTPQASSYNVVSVNRSEDAFWESRY